MCVDTAEGRECNMHEDCVDDECVALKQPRTLGDYVAAYEHWKDHAKEPGACAHGY